MSTDRRILTFVNDDKRDELEVANSVLNDILENSTKSWHMNLLKGQCEISVELCSTQPQTFVSRLRKVKPTTAALKISFFVG